MNSLQHRDDVVFPKSLIQHRNEGILDGLGDAALLILQFIQPNDLYPVLVASKYLCLSKLANDNILWEKFFDSKVEKGFRWLSEHERNEVSKIAASNSQTKYKQALDLVHRYLKQRAQPIIDNRKKHIALNYKSYPRRPYGIPTKYPEKIKPKFKIVVVGDGSVGKTTLLYTHVHGYFPEDFLPASFELYHPHVVSLENETVELDLVDTAGQEDYDRLRPLSYPDTDVFIIMFALNNPISFEQVVDKWKPELNHYHPNVGILLCGSKLDTRTSIYFSESFRGDEIVMVSKEEGEYMAKKMGCIGYVEVSAKKKIGVNEVFDAALRCVGVDVNVPKKECVCSE